jgi:hypothetical protein
VIDATVRVHLAELLQPIAHNRSQIRIGRQAPRRALVQSQAAQRRYVDSSSSVISGSSATALDGDLPFRTQTIQDSPECWLTEPRSNQALEIRRPQARWLGHQELQHLFSRGRPHGQSPTAMNK